jgi:hypothetical protein
MGRIKTDYSKLIIYVIKCQDDNITEEYIGSTTNFTKRKYQHKSCCNNEKDKNYHNLKYKFIRENGGWDNWIMLEVLKYPCNDKREAERREEEIRLERKAKLNSIKAFGAKTIVEYQKQYHLDNKETRQEQMKQWYDQHKISRQEYNKIYQKIYYENNKIKIIEKNKKYNELNKDKIKEQKQKYNEEHKEEIQKYQKQYRKRYN